MSNQYKKINISLIADTLHAYSGYKKIVDFIYEENKREISEKWNLHTKEAFYEYNKSTIDEKLEQDITKWFAIKISKMPQDEQLKLSKIVSLEELEE